MILRPLTGVVVLTLLTLNAILWGVPILLAGVVKLIAPGRIARQRVRLFLTELGDRWTGGNDRIFDRMLGTVWDVCGVDALSRDGHYLIVSNHTSWLDILVLQRAFHRRVAFIRFFIKQELIWLPIVGQACWAMDFPFMRRHTPEYLEKHPEERGRDLETTRRSIRRYKHIPLAIVNFLEGTRFDLQKHAAQSSPYRHLLRPRTGGAAFALASLGERLDGVVDVTLAYPRRDVTLWDFVTNGVERIVVRARFAEVPARFLEESIVEQGPARDAFREWIHELWRQKDELLDVLYRGTFIPWSTDTKSSGFRPESGSKSASSKS